MPKYFTSRTITQLVSSFGHSNDDGRCVYTLGSNVVKVVKEERDFGVIVHKSLKQTKHLFQDKIPC